MGILAWGHMWRNRANRASTNRLGAVARTQNPYRAKQISQPINGTLRCQGAVSLVTDQESARRHSGSDCPLSKSLSGVNDRLDRGPGSSHCRQRTLVQTVVLELCQSMLAEGLRSPNVIARLRAQRQKRLYANHGFLGWLTGNHPHQAFAGAIAGKITSATRRCVAGSVTSPRNFGTRNRGPRGARTDDRFRPVADCRCS